MKRLAVSVLLITLALSAFGQSGRGGAQIFEEVPHLEIFLGKWDVILEGGEKFGELEVKINLTAILTTTEETKELEFQPISMGEDNGEIFVCLPSYTKKYGNRFKIVDKNTIKIGQIYPKYFHVPASTLIRQ